MDSIVGAALASGAPESLFDIWSAVHANENGDRTEWLSNRMCAYLSVGGTATIANQFHEKRKNNPERYNTPWKNKFAWGVIGANFLFQSEQNISDKAHIATNEGNLKLPPNSKDCLLLNVNSFSAGVNFFKTSDYINKSQMWHEPAVGDGLLEMYSGTGSSSVPVSMVFGKRVWSRLSQTNDVTIELTEPQHVHLDGEAWEEQPGTITVSHHVVIRMLLGGLRPRNVNSATTHISTEYVRDSFL